MIAQHQLQKGFGKVAIVGALSVMAIGLTAEMSLAIPLIPIFRRAVEGILGIPSNPQNQAENQQQFPQGAVGYPETFPPNAAPQYPGQPNSLPQQPTYQQPTYQQPTYQQPTYPPAPGYPVYQQPSPAGAPTYPPARQTQPVIINNF